MQAASLAPHSLAVLPLPALLAYDDLNPEPVHRTASVLEHFVMANPAPEHLSAAGGDDVALPLVVDARHDLLAVVLGSGICRRGPADPDGGTGHAVADAADAAEEGGREARQQAAPRRWGGGADRRLGAVHQLLYLKPALEVGERLVAHDGLDLPALVGGVGLGLRRRGFRGRRRGGRCGCRRGRSVGARSFCVVCIEEVLLLVRRVAGAVICRLERVGRVCRGGAHFQ